MKAIDIHTIEGLVVRRNKEIMFAKVYNKQLFVMYMLDQLLELEDDGIKLLGAKIVFPFVCGIENTAKRFCIFYMGHLVTDNCSYTIIDELTRGNDVGLL